MYGYDDVSMDMVIHIWIGKIMGLAPWSGKKIEDALDGWYFGGKEDDDTTGAGVGGLRLGLDFHHKLELMTGEHDVIDRWGD